MELDLPTLRGGYDFPIKYGYASVGRVVEAGQQSTLRPVKRCSCTTHTSRATSSRRICRSRCRTTSIRPGRVPGQPRDGDQHRARRERPLRRAGGGVRPGRGRSAGHPFVASFGPARSHRRRAHRRATRPGARSGRHARAAPEQLTEGLDVDVAIEVSGNAGALQQAIDSLAFGGTVVLCSWYGTKPVALQLGGGFHRRRPRIVSSQVSTIDGALQPRWTHRRRLDLALDLLPSLPLDDLISQRFPLARAADAYALVDQHPEQTVQVVLTYPEPRRRRRADGGEKRHRHVAPGRPRLGPSRGVVAQSPRARADRRPVAAARPSARRRRRCGPAGPRARGRPERAGCRPASRPRAGRTPSPRRRPSRTAPSDWAARRRRRPGTARPPRSSRPARGRRPARSGRAGAAGRWTRSAYAARRACRRPGGASRRWRQAPRRRRAGCSDALALDPVADAQKARPASPAQVVRRRPPRWRHVAPGRHDAEALGPATPCAAGRSASDSLATSNRRARR